MTTVPIFANWGVNLALRDFILIMAAANVITPEKKTQVCYSRNKRAPGATRLYERYTKNPSPGVKQKGSSAFPPATGENRGSGRENIYSQRVTLQ